MSDNKQKLVVEVLADNNIENLTDEILTAMREAVGADEGADLSEYVSQVVTGVSPEAARGVIQHAASEGGLDTDWNSDEFDVFQPNVDSAMEFLDEEDYERFDDPEQSMSRDAYRKAANFRTQLLCEGTDDNEAADQFVLIHDAEGANSSARAFADNVLEHGGVLAQHPVEGAAPDEDSDAEQADDEPADEEVEEEFEDLVADE